MTVVRWTQGSYEDLAGIWDGIVGKSGSPTLALNLIDWLIDETGILQENPEAGARLEESSDPTIRRLVRRDYKIIYKVFEGFVSIRAVVRTVQDVSRLDLNRP